MKWLKNMGICGTKRNNVETKLFKHSRNYGIQPKPQRQVRTKWNSAVGLEIHAQINSKSKLFSGASANYGMPINSCVSMFDCATPGTLPTLNRRCVEAGVLAALALSCEINRVSLFDRKHYFYADLPAGYQITQQRKPLAVNGELRFNVFTPGIHKQPYAKLSKIKQIQLEQDSGKSLHDPYLKKSLVDLNRAGVPLIELVFEPDLEDGEEAAALVKELAMIFQRLDICSSKMEEGALRVDANVSVNEADQPLGVRTEVKNIGSVRGVAGAIKYEIDRQINMLESGRKIVNETLSWDAENNRTVSMRDKEEGQDYRFMPESNLPPLHLHTNPNEKNIYDLVDVNFLRSTLPELPEETRKKLHDEFGLASQTTMTIVNEDALLRLFKNVMRDDPKRSGKLVANILIMELMTLINEMKLQLEFCTITDRHIGNLVELLESEMINLKTAKKVLAELIELPEKMPIDIVEENNWLLINDEKTLVEVCKIVIEKNEKIVKQYKSGNKKVMNALLGEIARKTDQRANMAKVHKIMEELLK